MKNKKSKMSFENIFVGLLIGLVILFFGWKIYLTENPQTTEINTPDPMLIDQTLNKDNIHPLEYFFGEWKAGEGEDAKTINFLEAGGVSTDLEGITNWELLPDGKILLLSDTDSEKTYELTSKQDELVLVIDGNETVYKKTETTSTEDENSEESHG